MIGLTTQSAPARRLFPWACALALLLAAVAASRPAAAQFTGCTVIGEGEFAECRLQDLIDNNGTITVDDLIFDSFAASVDPSSLPIDLGLIGVQGRRTASNIPGLFFGNRGTGPVVDRPAGDTALGVTGAGSKRLSLQYRVRTVDGSNRIVGAILVSTASVEPSPFVGETPDRPGMMEYEIVETLTEVSGRGLYRVGETLDSGASPFFVSRIRIDRGDFEPEASIVVDTTVSLTVTEGEGQVDRFQERFTLATGNEATIDTVTNERTGVDGNIIAPPPGSDLTFEVGPFTGSVGGTTTVMGGGCLSDGAFEFQSVQAPDGQLVDPAAPVRSAVYPASTQSVCPAPGLENISRDCDAAIDPSLGPVLACASDTRDPATEDIDFALEVFAPDIGALATLCEGTFLGTGGVIGDCTTPDGQPLEGLGGPNIRPGLGLAFTSSKFIPGGPLPFFNFETFAAKVPGPDVLDRLFPGNGDEGPPDLDVWGPGDEVTLDGQPFTLGNVSVLDVDATTGDMLLASTLTDPILPTGLTTVIFFPGGDKTKGRTVCVTDEPVPGQDSSRILLVRGGSVSGGQASVDVEFQPTPDQAAISATLGWDAATGAKTTVLEQGDPVPGLVDETILAIRNSNVGQGLTAVRTRSTDSIAFADENISFFPGGDPSAGTTPFTTDDLYFDSLGDSFQIDGINDWDLGGGALAVLGPLADGGQAIGFIPTAAVSTVPDVVGLTEGAAEAAIVAAGLTVGIVTTQNSITVPAGDVISQTPLAGASVAPGRAVDLVVSLGPAPNVAPTVDAGPDATIDEGGTFLSAGSFSDPDSDAWTATVDYGEGAGPQPLLLNPDGSFALSNLYEDNGVFIVTVAVTDDDGGVGVDTTLVTVNNVAPTVDAGPDAILDEGDTFVSAGSFTDPGADTWTATVDYGDGSGPQSLALNPDNTFALSHTYVDDGVFTVTVAVTDDDGGVGVDTATVTVNNVAPAVDAGPDATIDEGDTFVSAGSFTDPGADTWTATVDYGDGSGPQSLALNPDNTFALSHVYPDDGVFAVTVTVTDDDGGTGADTAVVTVNAVAPTVEGDVDGDGDVDRDDLGLILEARNNPADGPNDPRDLDGDGVITVLDARKVAINCTRPRCATQ